MVVVLLLIYSNEVLNYCKEDLFVQEQVATLKIELAAVENERKKLEKFRVMWEEERMLYESACKDAEEKVEQYWADMKSAISSKEVLFLLLYI